MSFFKEKINETLSIFTEKIVTFGGNNDDLVWVYTTGATDRNMSVLAEAPNEVVHVSNGAIAAKYSNQKIKYKYSKNDINKYFFVNVKKPCQTVWGTSQKLEYKDSGSGKIVSIGANGVISFVISDSIVFLEKILGNRSSYSSKNLIEEMLPRIFNEFNDHLLSVIQGEKLEYSQLDGKLKEIGEQLLLKIEPILAQYGVHVEEFIIKQFVKPEELKDRTNLLAEEVEEFEDRMLLEDRRIVLMKKQEELEKQRMQMEQSRTEHEIGIAKMSAQLESDIEKMGYEAKEASYKELREMDREDIRTFTKGVAKIEESVQIPQDTVVVVKADNRGKCPYCDGEVAAADVFCPTCKKKLI